MDSMLVIVTVASLALSALMGIVVVKMVRDERRRSEARAALLAELASQAASEDNDALADFHLHDDDVVRVAPDVASSDLFVARGAGSAWPRRIAIVGALAAILVVTGVAVRSLATPDGARPAARETNVQASPEATTSLLELMSLTHVEEKGSLRITGLVQNPRDGVPLSKVTATAFVFGADGTFLASGKAPLDFTTLRAGDESGFVIDVSVSAPVARYRVGFRGEDGRIIGHVDRRESATIARGPS
jgi:hypothetical protein